MIISVTPPNPVVAQSGRDGKKTRPLLPGTTGWITLDGRRFHLNGKGHPDEFFREVIRLSDQLAAGEKRLAWLLDFAQRTEIRKLGKDELRHVQQEVIAFCISPKGFASADLQKCNPRTMRRLSEKVRDCLRTLMANGVWVRKPEPRRLAVSLDGEIEHVPQFDGFDLASHFLSLAEDLIEELFTEIRHCKRPECARWFVRIKRKEFCSDRCAAYDRRIKWRAVPENREKERAQSRESYYEKARKMHRSKK
jgi:hypothetical protein